MLLSALLGGSLGNNKKKKQNQGDYMKVLQAGKVTQPKFILCIYIISELSLFIKVSCHDIFPHYSTLVKSH